jgi:predicted HTH transcriptional regulator
VPHIILTFVCPVDRALDATEKAQIDLGRGENEQVEFKPFITPNDPKETEIVETAIAFANYSGGAIYIGVRDRDGLPLGVAELRKSAKKDLQSHADLQALLVAQCDRTRWVITNKIHPIPQFRIEIAMPYGEPVVQVQIEAGSGVLYATHDNQIFIRRGATNRRPGENELRQLLQNQTWDIINADSR